MKVELLWVLYSILSINIDETICRLLKTIILGEISEKFSEYVLNTLAEQNCKGKTVPEFVDINAKALILEGRSILCTKSKCKIYIRCKGLAYNIRNADLYFKTKREIHTICKGLVYCGLKADLQFLSS